MVKSIVDLQRYPIDDLASPATTRLIAETRERLGKEGCAVLKGFVNREALAMLVEEAEHASPNAHASRNRTNVYFTQDDPTLPDDHPARRFFERSNAFIPADNFAKGSGLRAIYDFPPFANFIRLCLGEREDRFSLMPIRWQM